MENISNLKYYEVGTIFKHKGKMCQVQKTDDMGIECFRCILHEENLTVLECECKTHKNAPCMAGNRPDKQSVYFEHENIKYPFK